LEIYLTKIFRVFGIAINIEVFRSSIKIIDGTKMMFVENALTALYFLSSFRGLNENVY